MRKKKAQGMSLNVIIIAALALLVLVILALILTGRIGFFNRESGDCSTMGGSCLRTGCTGDFQKKVGYNCDLDGDGTFNEGQSVDGVCCITV